MAAKLYMVGGKAYLIDMDAFKRKMFEPMPLTVVEPTVTNDGFSRDIFVRLNLDYAPNVMDSRHIVLSTFDAADDGWRFVFLFPLGKRAYIRRKR